MVIRVRLHYLQRFPSLEKGKTGMMEHATLRKPSSGFPLLWRLLIAFVAGLLLGLPGYFLLNGFGGAFPVLVLVPPLLGGLGRLAAARTKRPLWSGSWLGGLAWFGTWLAGVLWLILDPPAVQVCIPSCDGQAIPEDSIWVSGLAPLILAIYVIFLLVLLPLVLAGVAVTHFVLKQIAKSRATPR
jgi:hypothetical protein